MKNKNKIDADAGFSISARATSVWHVAYIVCNVHVSNKYFALNCR